MRRGRELDHYPPQAIRLSQPLPGDSWGRPEPRAVLPPAADPRHPYRVEVALPRWVLAQRRSRGRGRLYLMSSIAGEAPISLMTLKPSALSVATAIPGLHLPHEVIV